MASTTTKQKSTKAIAPKQVFGIAISDKSQMVETWMALRNDIRSAKSTNNKEELSKKEGELNTFLSTLNKNNPKSAERKLREWNKKKELFHSASEQQHKRLPANTHNKNLPPKGVRVLPPINHTDILKQKVNNLLQLLQHKETLDGITLATDINNAIKISIFNVNTNDPGKNYKQLIKHFVSNKIIKQSEVKDLPSIEDIKSLTTDTIKSDDTLSSMNIQSMDLLIYEPRHEEHNFPQPIHSDTPAMSATEFEDQMQFSLMLTQDCQHTTFYNTNHVPKITCTEQFAQKYNIPHSILSKKKEVIQHIQQWGRLLEATQNHCVSMPSEQFSLVVMDGGVPHCSPGALGKFRVIVFGTASKETSTNPST